MKEKTDMFKNTEKTCLFGGRLFDGKHMIDNGGVLFDKKKILSVFEGPPPPGAALKIDVMDRLITPGLVDLHSDALEKCIEMRPGVHFDPEFALQNLDNRIAGSGITSFCHAISFADEELGLRSPEHSARLVHLIYLFDQSPMSLVNHFVHARFEVGSTESAGILKELMEIGAVNLLSLMDHTPGQGQFKTMQSYLNFYKRSYGLEEEKVIEFAERKQRQNRTNWEDLAQLCEIAVKKGIPILSHDDDTSEKIDMLVKIGVHASEFPVSLEAAQAASNNDMKLFMGAPNLIRDRSTNGHLKASETIAAGLCHGLVSDYYPECLLQAPFIAQRKHGLSLENLFALITSKPAGFLLGTDSAGRLHRGSSPDIIVMDTTERWARIQQTWVKGECVYQSKPVGGRPVEKEDIPLLSPCLDKLYPKKVEESYDSFGR
jgi:alpha-D-ribose 1-methylphosphonate 5-triphosphate diphosphatase